MRIPRPDEPPTDISSDLSVSDGTSTQRPMADAPELVQSVPAYNPGYTTPPVEWPTVKLRLEVKDMGHKGAKLFFEHVNPAEAMSEAVSTVFKWLYKKQTCPRHVRSITLFLEDMDGVAYTRGSDLDDDHKEIHLSMRHIVNCKDRTKDEVLGVLVHETVHCFQYNAKGTCPGGLIEGIADYVRLKAELSPPHWKRGGSRWNEGYQTTAYFLEWIEEKQMHGRDFVRQLNGALRQHKYDDQIFKGMTGEEVDVLWKSYKADCEKEK